MGSEDAAREVSADPGDRRWWRRGLVAGLLLLLVTAYFLTLQERLSWEAVQARRLELQQEVDRWPLLAPLAFSLFYAAVTSLALPITPPLSVLAGALFGRALALVVVSCGSTAGASVVFLLSRYLLRDAVERRWGTRLAALQRGVETEGVYYLLALRLSPVVPFTLINLGMGLTRMPLRTFWWVSQLGMLPIAFLFVNAGAELGQVQTPGDVLSPGLLISLSLAAVVPLGLRKAWTWRQRG
jgi:uncharacterized membrane protein YdjX (TVP38/TMEM64 family)